MSLNPPELLERYKTSKLCMADWKHVLAAHFDALSPLLMHSVGELSCSYPTDENHDIRYSVAMRKDRYMGFVSDDFAVVGIEDRWFEVEDLQLWMFDPGKVSAFLGPVHAPPVANKPIAKVYNDFHSITLPSGKSVVFGRKKKRRIFLRLVAKHVRENHTDHVSAYELIMDHNATLPKGEASPNYIHTNDVVYDLFKDQSDEFKQLFEILDLTAGSFRLKVAFVPQ
jgi:hypothetical protein